MYDGLNKCIFDPSFQNNDFFVSVSAHIQVTVEDSYNVNTEARGQNQNSWVPEPRFCLMNSLTFKQWK